MKLCLWLGLLALAPGLSAHAQWSAKWLQDDAYWGDGKAEFNVYEANEIRYDQPRRSNVIHILERETFASKELAAAKDPKQPGTYPVLKLNQVIYIPTGVYAHHFMHSSYWKPDTGQLLKATLSGNDSINHTYRDFRALSGWRTWLKGGWSHHWHTSREGQSEGQETISADKDATFYDELPMRVRTIDFTPGSGAFAIPLAPSIIGPEAAQVSFTPHMVEWRLKSSRPSQGGRPPVLGTITVTVKPRAGKGEDVFILDAQPPHLLREWRKRDGGTLILQKSFKIEYRKLNKLGDLGRLLKEAQEEQGLVPPAAEPEGNPPPDEPEKEEE